MKKIVFFLLLLQSCVFLNAQMSRWVMHPNYDSIYIALGAPVLISDSLGITSLWNLKGERMATTKDELHPFVEGHAVVTGKDSDELKGFYNVDGKFVELNGYTTAYSYCRFSNGLFLAYKDGNYHFLNAEGEPLDLGTYDALYPFNQNLAVFFAYEDKEKQKNPHYGYIDRNQQKTVFKLKDKPVDSKDIQFLSTLNDKGQGVAVIKEKVYFYDKETSSLVPVFAGKGEQYQKKQLSVFGEPKDYLCNLQDSIVLKTRAGKKEFVMFQFNKWLKPSRYKFMDYEEVFDDIPIQAVELQSPFSSVEDTVTHKFGLQRADEVLLPAQFNQIGFCFDNFAVVRKNDKWGVVLYDESLNYRLIMHGGKDIAFRHQTVNTYIKLELPVLISADKCRFDVDKKAGCVIDKISIETKNTENGNFVAYQCALSIPDSLPDVLTEIQYPVQITYDGLIYPISLIKAKAWHYKYINVNLDDSEMKLGKGNVSFVINVSVDKQPGDDDYPFQIEVRSDSIRSELIKISETRYECKLFSLHEGANLIVVSVLETGCPPSFFPFEITYVKPIGKTPGSPAVKESVVIEKRGFVGGDNMVTRNDSLAIDSVRIGTEQVDPIKSDSVQVDSVLPTPAIMQDLLQDVVPVDAL